MNTAKLLELKNITKSFPGVKALTDVSFDLYAGEVLALLGENGAGKSTLMKILSGVYTKDHGEIFKNGKKIEVHTTKDAMRHGINIVYQEFNLCPHLTVSDNVFLTREYRNRRFPIMLHHRQQEQETQKIMDMLNQSISPSAKINTLSVGEQQMVEIAKALSVDCDILVMDEPTAALTESEIENLFQVIRELKSQKKGIIYISHRLHELDFIADRVTVLRDGKKIDTLNYKETTVPHLIKLMVGREIDHLFPTRTTKAQDTALFEVRNLSKSGISQQNISFSLKQHEILGIAGLMGSGRTSLARTIFGADKKISGQIFLNGKEIKIKSPLDAIKQGLGYLTEDRKNDGLLLNLPLIENVLLASIKDYSLHSVIRKNKVEELAHTYVKLLNIKTPSIFQKTMFLSGGNQQKVILSRWLAKHCKVLIFDEPTRGIDVGSKYEIYEIMNELIEKGVGIIMISSELPELLGMSDRILVMNSGHVAGICDATSATQEDIMHLATKNIRNKQLHKIKKEISV